MITVELKAKGLKQLIDSFNKAPVIIYKALDTAVKRSAWIITRDIKAVTPVDTGNLKRGIRPEFRPMAARILPHNAPYAIYVHEGTSRMRPRPFMLIGLRHAMPAVENDFNKAIDVALKEITK